MSANRFTAVMQRRLEPHDSLDYFPTPPWATRALCEKLLGAGHQIQRATVWEPACGEGHMAKPLDEFFDKVFASDVHDYRPAYAAQNDVCDFLCEWDCPPRLFNDGCAGSDGDGGRADWVITNPPFRLAEEFIQAALQRATVGVAVFVRTSFLEGIGRHRSLFQVKPPATVLQFAERVPLVKGRLDRGASSATSYCWIVWLCEGSAATMFDWIAPCRGRLDRAIDYPEPQAAPARAPLLGEGML